jgi:integrase
MRDHLVNEVCADLVVGRGLRECHLRFVRRISVNVATPRFRRLRWELYARLDLSGEWVFTNSGRGRRGDDGPVRPHNFNRNVWEPARARAKDKGLTKRPRGHDLRHTNASWLIQAGVPLTVIQRHLGHESIQTTSDRYGHPDRKSSRVVADVVGKALKPWEDQAEAKERGHHLTPFYSGSASFPLA